MCASSFTQNEFQNETQNEFQNETHSEVQNEFQNKTQNELHDSTVLLSEEQQPRELTAGLIL